MSTITYRKRKLAGLCVDCGSPTGRKECRCAGCAGKQIIRLREFRGFDREKQRFLRSLPTDDLLAHVRNLPDEVM